MPELWETYNTAAAHYQSVRPAYPSEVYDAIESYAGDLPAERLALEIGAGTGQATRQLAERGWGVVGLEPGEDLSVIARHELADFSRVEIQTCTFEAAPIADDRFDLVAAATSWHWVDAAVGYPKAARIVRNTGTIALWWNAHDTDTADPRWAPIRSVYEQVAPELARLARLTPDRPDYDPAGELAASGLFTDIEQHTFAFTVDYTVDQFLALLQTYASHQRLDRARREALDERLAAAISTELDGRVTKPYEAVVVLAKPAA